MVQETEKISVNAALDEYWTDRDRVADLFNAVLYEGDQKLSGKDLTRLDDALHAAMGDLEHAQKASHPVHAAHLWGAEQAWLLLLRTDKPDYSITYDALSCMTKLYGWQIEELSKAMIKAEQAGGAAAGHKKLTAPKPVSVVVLYTGTLPWDAALETEETLPDTDLLQNSNVMNVQAPIVDAWRNRMKYHNVDNLNVRAMLEIAERDLSAENASLQLSEYIDEHHPSRDAIEVVSAIIGEPTLLRVHEERTDGIGGLRTAFQDFADKKLEEGRSEGRLQIIEMGLEAGLEDDVIVKYLERLAMSREAAQELLAGHKAQHPNG